MTPYILNSNLNVSTLSYLEFISCTDYNVMQGSEINMKYISRLWTWLSYERDCAQFRFYYRIALSRNVFAFYAFNLSLICFVL